MMSDFFVRTWWAMALRGLVGILFGILALAWPALTLITLVALFAAYALLAGIASVAGALRHKHSGEEWWGALLLGAVSIGAGVIAVLNPALSALVLVLVMGANALVAGVIDILAAIRLREDVRHAWLLALAGLVSVAFGAFVFLRPGAGALALVWMVSLCATLSGALLLALALRMRLHARAPQAAGRASEARLERRVLHDRRMSAAR
jgi:uncharacterized membrane protein HdeD (DUF308 family)